MSGNPPENDWMEYIQSETCKRRIEKGRQLDIAEFERRRKHYPMLLRTLGDLVGGYMKGRVDDGSFRNSYLNSAVPFYKRVEAGEQREQFAESFRNEIELMRQVSKACDEGGPGLYDTVYRAVEEYLNKPFVTPPLFLI